MALHSSSGQGFSFDLIPLQKSNNSDNQSKTLLQKKKSDLINSINDFIIFYCNKTPSIFICEGQHFVHGCAAEPSMWPLG